MRRSPRCWHRISASGPVGTTRREAMRSALQQRRDALGKLLERGLALEHLAIDEEGRCRIDLQNFVGVFLVGCDLVEQRLILEAILDILFAKARLLADPLQGFG